MKYITKEEKFKILQNYKTGKIKGYLKWTDHYQRCVFALEPKDILSIENGKENIYIEMIAVQDFNFGRGKRYKKGEVISNMVCDDDVVITIHAYPNRKKTKH